MLAAVIICGNGLITPDGVVKLSAFTCSKAVVPTVTLMGIVTSLPAVSKTSWPVKVPGTWPAPGKFAGTIVTVTVEGAAPVVAEVSSQLPPSDVLLLSVQLKVPAPAFLI